MTSPVHELVVEDAPATEAEARRLQAALRPGGRLVVRSPRHPSRLARRLRHYFEGGPVPDGRRFFPVQVPRKGEPLVAYRRGPELVPGHFNDLGGDYDRELPRHLAAHYLDRKMAQLTSALGGRVGGLLGLDAGCGLAPYAAEASRRLGARMVGVDAAPSALAAASRRPAGKDLRLAAADTLHLPFADGTFDFAYTVNMVHHLKRGEQDLAVAELLRVLKPGAPLVVFEINVLNPLFRFYMRYVFPRTRRIDRGDEEFLTPRALAKVAGQRPERVRFMTFLPDFTPRWSMPLARPLERALEAVAGPLAIHYSAVLRRAA